ncbi:putative leader peptide [Actinoallomurus sp. NPDC050550]|uniref:putative leader peptide n=1 Tax=Actinoallomurus sp. NPDC050550 TaxID=3154937 RepID=UPI0033DB15E4
MRRFSGVVRPGHPADSRSFRWHPRRPWGVLGERFTSRWPRWGFTKSETPLTIVSVRSWTELLTKRRAVDFCRVATALCPAA